ncbi:MAG: TonB-dependent receptor [bacterium]|nr:TonB-dependent receptor [bacterium]
MRRLLLCLLLLLISVNTTAGEPAAPVETDVFKMSLEDLMQMTVTSVTRREDRFFDSAAAVYVITQEDIRRSGMTTLPELLRMVPGMEVARFNSNIWTITSRGFNSYFARKLLVLIDGRSVYTPLFAGVYWDVQDLMLEDVERIEVIRGPGGTLWGANAMNGVINVITKSAADTRGWLVVGQAGTIEKLDAGLRYGARLGEVDLRGYAKFSSFDSFQPAAGGAGFDDWHTLRGGFRLDWQRSERDRLTVQADVYGGERGVANAGYVSFDPLVRHSGWDVDEVSGGNLLARWERGSGDETRWALVFYCDRARRDEDALGQRIDTLDLELDYFFPRRGRHRVTVGGGQRVVSDDLRPSLTNMTYPLSQTSYLTSAFAQDEITVSDRVRFTLGSKFEWSSYTGFEILPNARVLFKVDERRVVWGAISRAVSTPSRLDRDVRINRFVFEQPDGSVILGALFGNRDIESEELLAVEIGYRSQATARLFLDLTAFHFRYDNITSQESEAPFFETAFPPPHLTLPMRYDDKLDARSSGIEAAVRWQVRDHWRIHGSLSWLELDLVPEASSNDQRTEGRAEGNSPGFQFSIRSQLDVGRRFEIDHALYYVDRLDTGGVPSHLRADMRVGFRLGANLDLSLVGRNLLEGDHRELGETVNANLPFHIPRSFMSRLTLRF